MPDAVRAMVGTKEFINKVRHICLLYTSDAADE